MKLKEISDAITMIDITMIDAIRDLQSEEDPDVLASIVSLFLEGMPERLASLKAAIEAGVAKKVQAEAHSMKSSTASLGAAQMSALSRQLEMMGASGQLSEAAATFQKLEAEWSAVQAELRALPEMNSSARAA
jgi:HPt (histidine-containing phosphotransfer) domain-containing protein